MMNDSQRIATEYGNKIADLAMQTRLGEPLQYEDVRLEARTAITQVEKGGN